MARQSSHSQLDEPGISYMKRYEIWQGKVATHSLECQEGAL